jgi:hypothetical protein
MGRDVGGDAVKRIYDPAESPQKGDGKENFGVRPHPTTRRHSSALPSF